MCFLPRQGITKRLILLYIFYVLLMTNQNTKNMCLFPLLLTFSGKDLDQKRQKMTRLDKVKVRSTAVKPELIESFPRFFG